MAGLLSTLVITLTVGAERVDARPDRAWRQDWWQSVLFGTALGVSFVLAEAVWALDRDNGVLQSWKIGACAAVALAAAGAGAACDAWRTVTLFLQLAVRGVFLLAVCGV